MSTAFELLLAELMAEFLDELPGRCNALEDAVMALEGGNAGAFDELFRQVHSLKGTGGGVGIPIITTICHQFESFIGEAKQRFDRKAANTSLAFIDLLRKTIPASGREPAEIGAIEHALNELRMVSLSGRASILVVEPSNTVRRLYQKEFSDPSTQVHFLKGGLEALERLLHEPFDLLVISRELPDLNAQAVVAALREARCRNSEIPVILVSSNTTPVPEHLKVNAILRRDVRLIPELVKNIRTVLAKRHVVAKLY
jgi:CheY-like chemotaxis protein/HPt (histidine-containing phosphotransfer) domain-containing protein